ncbi:MAG: helix-turn-helix domain-containing protein [Saprospiraceae bacterium]|nr:helix-turn-helix domain-containing protein [Saprospiraceae bacterium]MCF8248929.1 helix-turn-helix domain-containing protein [Saprospiraceae bacterium]MCF8279140.1 helix-turn-helix domain-containing protein [Bacteroidales bacterium]MCF8310823.1 helix-turn-helix domain-containing protein [Saprospiraceae bacterium]MCF8439589.1 helix-turn-helix domain-containing protein [Saprospiraceae bacterium]
MNINEKIRKIRIEKGYSQEYLARCLDISQNGYSKLERGDTQITCGRLEKIAEAMNASVQEIFQLGVASGPDVQKRINDLENEVKLLKSILTDFLNRHSGRML